jgi:hypothetical protein
MISNPTQVLCINRKGVDTPIKERQSAFVNRFADGCNGVLISLDEAREHPLSNPWCIRGMKYALSVAECIDSGRTLYYIDNGYFGNWSRKVYFRIIKDNIHDTRPIINRGRDRLDPCQVYLKNFTSGRKILLAPPSTKSFSMWSINQEQWIAETVAEIKKYTDRPIEIRMKRTRDERMHENTMEEALADDVHCLVTYNSVAAVEAVMLGKPAITLGPNAAERVCSNTLAEIENPRVPSYDEREAWLRHLSYSQFTFDEMSDGTAWRILNDL